MAKITKENCLLISNSKLLALARRDEVGKINIYTVEPITLETLEKMLLHLTREENNEESNN